MIDTLKKRRPRGIRQKNLQHWDTMNEQGQNSARIIPYTPTIVIDVLARLKAGLMLSNSTTYSNKEISRIERISTRVTSTLAIFFFPGSISSAT